ncbi:hypothetical protein D3C87_719860 [compost metagenome]
MSAKILLPVKAHVKKYLERTHGSHLEVSDRGYAPLLLFRLLEKHKKQDPGTVRPSQKLIDDRKYFGYPIYIGDTNERKCGLYISNDSIKDFNEAIDDLIREQMYWFIHHPNSTDKVVDYNINRFRDWYGITEDELPFDNLKRWYYRERGRLTLRIENLIPPFTPQLTLNL